MKFAPPDAGPSLNTATLREKWSLREVDDVLGVLKRRHQACC